MAKLPKRRRKFGSAPIPTPAEIIQRRDDIQRAWSDQVRQSRSGSKPSPWVPPVFHVPWWMLPTDPDDERPPNGHI